MARLILFGATGSLGRHVLRQAASAGHDVTVLVRTASRLPPEAGPRVFVHTGDLRVIAQADLARLVGGHDVLVNCAGNVRDAQVFVDLVDRLVSSVECLPAGSRPVCWLLAGAALLDVDAEGHRGVDLPEIASVYWPHRANFERLERSGLDWRLLCPGPMLEGEALGPEGLRVSLDGLPVELPGSARALPDALLLRALGSIMPRLAVPYADAAALMLANIGRGGAMARRRVGIARS
jgi:putative NADH-flavin reductase